MSGFRYTRYVPDTASKQLAEVHCEWPDGEMNYPAMMMALDDVVERAKQDLLRRRDEDRQAAHLGPGEG